MNDMYLHITDFQMLVFFIINKLCRRLLEDNLRRFAFYPKNVQFIYDKRMRSVLSVKFRIMRWYFKLIILEYEFN